MFTSRIFQRWAYQCVYIPAHAYYSSKYQLISCFLIRSYRLFHIRLQSTVHPSTLNVKENKISKCQQYQNSVLLLIHQFDKQFLFLENNPKGNWDCWCLSDFFKNFCQWSFKLIIMFGARKYFCFFFYWVKGEKRVCFPVYCTLYLRRFKSLRANLPTFEAETLKIIHCRDPNWRNSKTEKGVFLSNSSTYFAKSFRV